MPRDKTPGESVPVTFRLPAALLAALDKHVAKLNKAGQTTNRNQVVNQLLLDLLGDKSAHTLRPVGRPAKDG